MALQRGSGIVLFYLGQEGRKGFPLYDRALEFFRDGLGFKA